MPARKSSPKSRKTSSSRSTRSRTTSSPKSKRAARGARPSALTFSAQTLGLAEAAPTPTRPILRLFDGFDNTSPQLRDEVKELQTELNKNGASLEVDGLFGRATEAAVKAFQKQHGLDDDGIVGARTWAALLGTPPPDTGMTFPTTFALNDPSMLANLAEANKFRSFVDEAANKFGIQPSIIAGIASVESDWGLGNRPPGSGPAGTGDFAKRGFPTQFRSGPLPPDGGGFGRGLMQIDYDAHEFARTGNWRDARENIFYGCQVLTGNMKFLKTKTGRDGRELLRLAIASYNCGAGNELKAFQQGLGVDFFTTGRNYSQKVLDRAGWFQLHGWP